MQEITDYHAATKVTGLPPGTLCALVCRKPIPLYRISKRLERVKQSELDQGVWARYVEPGPSLLAGVAR